MFLTDTEAKGRVEHSSLIVKNHRAAKRPHIPDSARALMAAAKIYQGVKAHKDFKCSIATISTVTEGKGLRTIDGKTRPAELPQPTRELISKVIDKAQETAALKLVEALELITPEKLENAKVRDISGVAADMARILEKTRPQNPTQAQNQILIYAPRTRDEDSFEVIVG